jgi:hypothetical protein
VCDFDIYVYNSTCMVAKIQLSDAAKTANGCFSARKVEIH